MGLDGIGEWNSAILCRSINRFSTFDWYIFFTEMQYKLKDLIFESILAATIQIWFLLFVFTYKKNLCEVVEDDYKQSKI